MADLKLEDVIARMAGCFAELEAMITALKETLKSQDSVDAVKFSATYQTACDSGKLSLPRLEEEYLKKLTRI